MDDLFVIAIMNWTGGRLGWIRKRPHLRKKDAEMQELKEHLQKRINNNNNDNSELDTEHTENAMEEHFDSQQQLYSSPTNNNGLFIYQHPTTTIQPVRDPNFLFNFFSTPPNKVIIV